MSVTVPKSVESFLDTLTEDGDGDLDLREAEAAYLVYCEAHDYEPVDLVDFRRQIDATEADTASGRVLNRNWAGLEAFLAEHQDAVQIIEEEYHPDNPDRAVPSRERHVYEYAAEWQTTDPA